MGVAWDRHRCPGPFCLEGIAGLAEIGVTVSQVDVGSFLVEFLSALGAQKYLYLDGLAWKRTLEDSVIVTPPVGMEVTLQAFDSESDVPDPVFPGQIALRWFGVANAVEYVVERENGAQWDEEMRMRSVGFCPYRWVSGLLDDVTVHTYRVLSVSMSGRVSVVKEQAVLVVRTPSDPGVAYSYDDVLDELTITG